MIVGPGGRTTRILPSRRYNKVECGERFVRTQNIALCGVVRITWAHSWNCCRYPMYRRCAKNSVMSTTCGDIEILNLVLSRSVVEC